MELSAEERTVYDRQLRVWGAEAQERLKNAQVLIIKANQIKKYAWRVRGVRDELIKNLALAGVGKLSLGLPSSTANEGKEKKKNNKRKRAENENENEGKYTRKQKREEDEDEDEDDPSVKRVRMLEGMRDTTQKKHMMVMTGEDRAHDDDDQEEKEEEEEEEAIAAALRDMNPLVNSSVMHLPSETNVETYTHVMKSVQCAVILDGGEGEQMVRVVSEAARSIGASSTDAGRGTCCGSSSSSVGVYVVDVRGMRGYFASDLGDAHRFREEGEQAKKGEFVVKYPPLEDVMGVEQSSLPKRLRRTAREEKDWQTHAPSDPAVDAIVGGVLAQDIVRFISKKGRPIFNFFCFNGAGWVLPLAMRDGDGEQHREEEAAAEET